MVVLGGKWYRRRKQGGICLSYSHKRGNPNGNANKTRSRMEDAKGTATIGRSDQKNRGFVATFEGYGNRTRGISISGTAECGVAVTSELTTRRGVFFAFNGVSSRGRLLYSLRIVLLKVVVSCDGEEMNCFLVPGRMRLFLTKSNAVEEPLRAGLHLEERGGVECLQSKPRCTQVLRKVLLPDNGFRGSQKWVHGSNESRRRRTKGSRRQNVLACPPGACQNALAY